MKSLNLCMSPDLAINTLLAFPRRLHTGQQWHTEQNSFLTVAGPCRIHTCFHLSSGRPREVHSPGEHKSFIKFSEYYTTRQIFWQDPFKKNCAVLKYREHKQYRSSGLNNQARLYTPAVSLAAHTKTGRALWVNLQTRPFRA